MKKRVALGIVGVALVVVGSAAGEVFTKAVAKADFSAAGLGKLSPEELARLDGLVRDHQSGALAAARRDAAAAEARGFAEARRAEGANVARAQGEAGGEKKRKGGCWRGPRCCWRRVRRSNTRRSRAGSREILPVGTDARCSRSKTGSGGK